MKNSIDSYLKCIASSERVAWKIEEILPNDFQLSFVKPFLPPSMTKELSLTFLTQEQSLALNHIRSASYINLFGFVEEFITAEIVQAASNCCLSDNERLRALLRFAEEEVKHQTLFFQYVRKFQNQFVTPCKFIGDAEAVAGVILSHSDLAVLLATVHLELITQEHYLSSIAKEACLDEQFANMLKKHWQEEAQHSRIDILELIEITKNESEENILASFHEYLGIVDALVGLLEKQVDMDAQSLAHATQLKMSDADSQQFKRIQLESYVEIFVEMGFRNKWFRIILNDLSPKLIKILDTKEDSMCRRIREAA